MPRLKKRSLETKARISRMKRAEKRREQILYLKTQAEEMEILWYEIRFYEMSLFYIILSNNSFQAFYSVFLETTKPELMKLFKVLFRILST